MKKLIICAAVVGAMLTSCGNNSLKTVPVKTTQDSLANSLGLLLGNQIRGMVGDEKLNPVIVANAVNAVLEAEKPEDLEAVFIEADAFLRNYMTVVVPNKKKASSDAYLANLEKSGVNKTESGLFYEIIEMGDRNVMIEATDTITVHYSGTLTDGTTFDSSYERNQPLVSPLNNLIAGWVEGLQLIGKGGKMKLTIPSDLAYGSQGQLAGETLIFELEVLDTKKAK